MKPKIIFYAIYFRHCLPMGVKLIAWKLQWQPSFLLESVLPESKMTAAYYVLRQAPMAHLARLGSKLRGTGFESRPGRMFVIGVVHIQCSNLFKGLECTVISMVVCTIKNPWSYSRRVGHSLDFGLPSFVTAMILHKATWSNIHSVTNTRSTLESP